MSLKFSPPPDGSPPLVFTATCEHPECAPRTVLHYTSEDPDGEAARDRWVQEHRTRYDHPVTVGTMRGTTWRIPDA